MPAGVLVFHSPRTSTGEDVVEYHVPGSPWIVSRLLERLFELGARQAEPGEFTSRAFFNGKLDLASAEGVVATIAASNRSGLDAARQLLAGELARRLRPMMELLADALALVEVGIDFSEEDVTFINRERLESVIVRAHAELRCLLDDAPRFERLEHEPRIVLAGRPNSGKSSLLNALADQQRAIVADVAGTTRDALSERVTLASGYVTIVDVAGLEEMSAATGPASDSIAQQMQVAAEMEIARADLVVLVHAGDDPQPPLMLARQPDLVVRSKADLIKQRANGVAASVVSDMGLRELLEALDAMSFPRQSTDAGGSLALNARHRSAISEATQSLSGANAAIERGSEFVAVELRAAIDHLGRVLGRVAPDDVLGRIFSSFCIGK